MIRRSYDQSDVLEKDFFNEVFDESFSLVAFIMNRFMVDHFIRAGRALVESDYESLIIFAVLAHQNVAHMMRPGSFPGDVLTERGRLPDMEGGLRSLRLRDLTQITGLPRETVRRKLKRLEGWRLIMRVGAGWQASTARVESDLREFTRESVYRFLNCGREIGAAFADVRNKRQPPTQKIKVG